MSPGNKRPDEGQTEQVKPMARHPKRHPPTEATHDEALRIARGTQRPGQTKEQTRLIAQGIQKGIEQYKKQQSARARELDKNLKKVKQQFASPETHEIEVRENVVYRQHWLPWVLLALSWIAMAPTGLSIERDRWWLGKTMAREIVPAPG
jgi:hypothetical protein